MATEENDILARFIRNEKKAKTWTLLSVGVFVALAFGILYLMSELKKAKDETENAKEATAKALAKADSINVALEEYKASQEIRAKLAKEEAAAPSPSKIYPVQRPIIVPEKNLVLLGKTRRKDITVFVQYKPEYYTQCNLLVQALKESHYFVPGKEQIKKINFASSVKYFNDSDKMWADSVAIILNNTLNRTGSNAVPVVKNSLTAPVGQLEIWMGDYKAPATSDLVKKYNPKNLKLKN
jgi:hypothetical protein